MAIDDRRPEKGRFVITGSSSPELLRSVSETLAGRVGIIELAPLSWEEVTQTSGRDSLLHRLLNRKAKAGRSGSRLLKPRGTVGRAHDFWFRGGFPEPWLMAASNSASARSISTCRPMLPRCEASVPWAG